MVVFEQAYRGLNTSTHTVGLAGDAKKACNDVEHTDKKKTSSSYNIIDKSSRQSEQEGSFFCYNSDNDDDDEEDDDDDDVCSSTISDVSDDSGLYDMAAIISSCFTPPPFPSQCQVVDATWEQVQMTCDFEERFGPLVLDIMIRHMMELDDDLGQLLLASVSSSSSVNEDLCRSLVGAVDIMVAQTTCSDGDVNDMFTEGLMLLGRRFQDHGMALTFLGDSVSQAVQEMLSSSSSSSSSALNEEQVAAWKAVIDFGATHSMQCSASFSNGSGSSFLVDDLWSICSWEDRL